MHYHRIMSRIHAINVHAITDDVNLDHSAEVVFLGFSTVKLLPPSFLNY